MVHYDREDLYAKSIQHLISLDSFNVDQIVDGKKVYDEIIKHYPNPIEFVFQRTKTISIGRFIDCCSTINDLHSSKICLNTFYPHVANDLSKRSDISIDFTLTILHWKLCQLLDRVTCLKSCKNNFLTVEINKLRSDQVDELKVIFGFEDNGNRQEWVKLLSRIKGSLIPGYAMPFPLIQNVVRFINIDEMNKDELFSGNMVQESIIMDAFKAFYQFICSKFANLGDISNEFAALSNQFRDFIDYCKKMLLQLPIQSNRILPNPSFTLLDVPKEEKFLLLTSSFDYQVIEFVNYALGYCNLIKLKDIIKTLKKIKTDHFTDSNSDIVTLFTQINDKIAYVDFWIRFILYSESIKI